jgi:hypothetical protein
MPFKKGQSGCPSGRPVGSTAQARLRKAMEEALPDIVNVMIDQAKAGDTTAAKILIDKICASARPQALPVNVPIGETLPETGLNIVTSTLTGQLAPDIGSMLIRALAEQSKLVELLDLTKRIEALESESGNQ